MALKWIRKHRSPLLLVSVPIVIAGWWWFRPEKLFVNERVNEAAPFASMKEPEPVYTGKFAGSGMVQGRATVYKSADGKLELRLTDLVIPQADDLRIVLAGGEQADAKSTVADGQKDELGAVLPAKMEQQFVLAAGTDLWKLSQVLIYHDKSKALVGAARLEPF